ncbi:hypothetical protein [Alkalicoccus luteus]|uniref:hypothetical protein n=1 Tax=Alkalicoccus luteus TaxID=1237094 RepID=UPI0040338BD9
MNVQRILAFVMIAAAIVFFLLAIVVPAEFSLGAGVVSLLLAAYFYNSSKRDYH